MLSNVLDQLYPTVKFDPDMAAEKLTWLIDGIWQYGKINAIAGFEKSGKSRLMTWLLVGMHGSAVLGLTAGLPPPKILYLAGEETIATVNDRIKRYAVLQGLPTDVFNIDLIEAAGMRFDLKDQRKWLIDKMLGGDYKMLVADPLRRLHGADENDSTAMSMMHNELRFWSNKYGLTMLLVHHTPKIGMDTDMTRMANWFRGSTDTAAILDTAQYVNRLNKQEISLIRAGRMAPLPDVKITDLGDKQGFTRRL